MNISERAVKLIRLIYGVTVVLCLALCAVLFIGAANGINALGTSPYTYDSIGAAFTRISIPVYITLALVVAGGVFFTFVLPDGKRRLSAPRDYEAQLLRAYRTADLSAAPNGLRSKLRFERRMRASLRLANAAYFAVGLAIALLCAVNPANYAEGISSHELTSSVLGVVYAAVIYLTPAVLMALLRIAINALSAEHELKLVKKLPKRKPSAPSQDVCIYKKRILLCSRILIVTLAAVLIVLGICNGGMQSVLEKAVKICTECIGLG